MGGAVYVVELAVRLSVVSFREYIDSNSNKFDLFATITLFIVGVVWAYPYIHIDDETLRYFTILRLLRLLRLFAQLERFEFICQCIWRMINASKEAIGLLFGTMFTYSAIGMLLFGGLIYDGNADLDDTDYRDSNFEVLNFNDMG